MAESAPSRQREGTVTLLPLVADSGNRRMLSDWITDHERYELTEEDLDAAAFDVCILDTTVLERDASALRARKRETSAIVPVLLLVPDREAASIQRELRQEHPSLWALVDGLLRVPIREYELDDQIETVLQLRDQSERLTRQQEQLRERSEQLEILNRVLRHDIRNDMTVVLGWLEYVADHCEGELAMELDRIESSAEHVVELTTAAGDIADTMSSDAEPDLEPTSLTGILLEEGEKRQETFENAVIELPESPPYVTVAANELLSSVFRNLINNAVQHSDREDPVVSISMRETDGRVRVRVADNGPGVPETLTDDLFGDEVKGLDSSGTGMGLYLVSTLVELYGGEVWVEDNDPTGAVFGVELDVLGQPPDGSGD